MTQFILVVCVDALNDTSKVLKSDISDHEVYKSGQNKDVDRGYGLQGMLNQLLKLFNCS